MEYKTTQKLQAELSSDESLLWSGRPKQGVFLRRSDILMIPFSLFWGGFAFFWEYSVYRTGAPPFLLLFGSIFVLIGLYMIFGRFLADAIRRKGTYYGVTSDRIVILSEFPMRKLKSLSLRTLSDITLLGNRGGSGTIVFGPQSSMASWMGGMSWSTRGYYQSPMFEYIKNARTVYESIRDAQKRLK